MVSRLSESSEITFYILGQQPMVNRVGELLQADFSSLRTTVD
jgi:hypothetical protein